MLKIQKKYKKWKIGIILIKMFIKIMEQDRRAMILDIYYKLRNI